MSPRRGGSRPPVAELPVEGECFDLEVASSWRRGAELWLSGELSDARLDLATLDLEPLALVGGDLQRPAAAWSRRRPAGPLPAQLAPGEYELERIPPAGRADSESGLHRAIELWAGDRVGAACEVLGELLRRDLRCLAAHACLGFFAFNAPPGLGGQARAQRHYQVGLAIGGLSIPAEFRGLLPWSRPGNRAYLRCLYGHSICLWRKGELERARSGFRRLCRLNPADQLAARLALDSIGRPPA